MSEKKNYYITTPIYYVNDVPHIGHAYTTVACDFMARFKRLQGYDVMFLTGTDEHGQKVQKSAEKAGVDPQAFTDKVSQNFRDLTKTLNFSNDDFIRTTEDRHQKAAQEIWQRLMDAGHIYLGGYSGWYSVRDEAFYTEDELTENSSAQKIAPTGAVCEWVEEPSYFFKLSAFQDDLLRFYEENPDFILPKSRRNEVLSFVKSGLNDLSISRTTFDWGVKVPNDEKHIMYVWLDALTNYLTAVGFADESKKESFEKFWPADLHMVGKDILRFHAIYWPAFLMGAGIDLPKRVFAHGWWTIEGQKMSKSLGNVICPHDLVAEYGVDASRYFLLREVPFGNDGDFSRTAMVQRINSNLSNDYGNLIQRVLSMAFKNCDAKLPQNNGIQRGDQKLLDRSYSLADAIAPLMDRQEFHKALEHVWVLIGDANKYVDEQAPWALRKTDIERMETVLYVLCEVIRSTAIIIQAIMPDAAAKILDALKVPADQRGFENLSPDFTIISGTTLAKPEPIFPRYVEEE